MTLRLALLSILASSNAAYAADADLDFAPATFDRQVSVCQDPYGYVNNLWLRDTVLPADRPMWGPRYAVIERNQQMQRALAERAAAEVARGGAEGDTALVGAFFASGMDEARIEAAGLQPIAADLARIDAIDSREALLGYLAQSSAQGIDLAFGYYVWRRYDDPSRYIVYVEEGGRGLADRERYLDDDERSKTLRTAYRAYLAKLLQLSGVPDADAQRQADEAFALEQALARASLPATAWDEPANFFKVRSADSVEQIAPHLDWNAFFAAQGFGRVDEFSLAQPDFFRELDRQIADAPLSQWRAYLRARLLDNMAPYLARPFAEQHFGLHSKLVQGIPAMPARWKQVLGVFNNTSTIGMNAIGMAMSRLFVDAHLPADAKPRALAMVADLRAAFRARIENADWMSATTRQAALDKLDRMGAKIGYPDRWPDLTGLVFDPHDYAGNIRAALRFSNQRMNAKLGQPADRDEWLIGLPHEVNARYNWDTNEIYFPAPMLQAPAFDPKQDPALNYAALGVIIGHEMTHGFDNVGARFDAGGRLHDWWSAEDKQRFETLGKRVIARYSGYEIGPGQPVNGQLTVSENIADLGGLGIAYDALQRALEKSPVVPIDGLTQQQRFFLRYAMIWRNKSRPEFADLQLKTNPHAPDRFRAIAPMSDMPEFAQAFSCKPGDATYRASKDRIGIW